MPFILTTLVWKLTKEKNIVYMDKQHSGLTLEYRALDPIKSPNIQVAECLCPAR